MAKLTLKEVSNTNAGADRQGASAVTDVSLDVADGEFLAVAGAARSGKSALLRLIAGLEPVSRGEILLGERRLNEVPAKDRDVALIVAGGNLYPHMTVEQNLAFGLKLRRFAETEIKKRVREAAEVLGTADLLARHPLSLSSEQRQRVAIGRAIVRQPKLFLFDDPLAGLEDAARAKLRTEIARLHQRLEATVIYATADPAEAVALGDRITLLRGGRVEQTGTPGEMRAAPANSYVATFVGNPPMNLLRGSLKQERDALLFSEADNGTVEVRFVGPDGETWKELVGRPVLLGIRPEDIQVVSSGTDKGTVAAGFPAIVDVVEPNSTGADLYLQTGAHYLVCRSRSVFDRLEAGRRMRFTIDPMYVHLFDGTSGERLR
ncbi:MAG: ABC transporter ATP-binding protein [Chthoniobacterales bacterium]|nr:ABC transporter ATP-binding protein [Chthoniobacterales bacterium]